MEEKYVQSIILAPELDKKVARAEAKVGNVTISGITVWRSGNGKLRAFLPSYPIRDGYWAKYVDLPAGIWSEVEAEIIAAYKNAKKSEKRGKTTGAERQDDQSEEV